jgi:hypothetical protein
MLLGVNENNEIIAVNDIPEGLTIIEIEDDTFGENDPTNFKIRVAENWMELTPRFPIDGL